MKIFAFTLAEILITLGIIGVVAAMTIPNLLTAHKKHVIESKLERAVSVINQTIKMSESENGEMETWDKNLTYTEFIDKYFRPYIKIMQICEGRNSCGYEGNRAKWTYLNGASGSYSSPFYNEEFLLFPWMEYCTCLGLNQQIPSLHKIMIKL